MVLTFFFHLFVLVFFLFFVRCSDESTNSDFIIKVILQGFFLFVLRRDFAYI